MLMLNMTNVDVKYHKCWCFHHSECGIGIAIIASFLIIRDYEVLCDMFALRNFGGEKDA